MRIPQRRSSRASFAQGLVIVSVLAALVALALTAGDSAHAQTAVPAAPTGLTAPTVAHNSVTLSWDDPGDTSITGYRILRRDPVNQAPGVFSTIVSNTGSAATSYTDGTVAATTRYVYRVKAINAAGTERAVQLRQRRDDRRSRIAVGSRCAHRPDRVVGIPRQRDAELVERPRRRLHHRLPGAQALQRRRRVRGRAGGGRVRSRHRRHRLPGGLLHRHLGYGPHQVCLPREGHQLLRD